MLTVHISIVKAYYNLNAWLQFKRFNIVIPANIAGDCYRQWAITNAGLRLKLDKSENGKLIITTRPFKDAPMLPLLCSTILLQDFVRKRALD